MQKRTRIGVAPRALRVERLEARMLLSGVEPTAYEQYLLELINRARHDPAAEAVRRGCDLYAGLAPGTISTQPKQPLAFSSALVAAARGHSEWMLAANVFDHVGKDGSLPEDRMIAAGYLFEALGVGTENIAAQYYFGMTGTTATIHANLFASPGHRANMMKSSHREAGMGLAHGSFAPEGYAWDALLATEDFAYSGGAGVFLTGVAYDDLGIIYTDQPTLTDYFYTPGEGLGGVTVKATRKSDGAVFSTTTWASGGYTLRLAAGAYTVIATGGALGTCRIVSDNVQIGSQNVKVDFVPTPIARVLSTIDLSIVRTPTATNSVGEKSSLSPSEAWIDEWDAYWVEVWVSTPQSDAAVASAVVDLTYDTACFMATAIEYGPAFTKNQTGAMDDAAGVVRDLGAATLLTNVGDDQYVLLARVKLASSAPGDAAGLPIAAHAYPAAHGSGIAAGGAEVTLVGGAEAEATCGDAPQTELWPVMYDLDDDGEVDLGDLSYFAAAYRHAAGDSGVAYTQVCDFDHDGEVGLGDLSYFAAAYRRAHTDPEPIANYCAPNFPEDWRAGNESLSGGRVLAGILGGTAAADRAGAGGPVGLLVPRVGPDRPIGPMPVAETRVDTELQRNTGRQVSAGSSASAQAKRESTGEATGAAMVEQYGLPPLEPVGRARRALVGAHAIARRQSLERGWKRGTVVDGSSSEESMP